MTGVINQRLNSQRTNLSKLVRKPIWPQTSSALHALDIIPGPGEMVVIEDRRIQLGDQQVRQNAVSQEKQSECVWRLRTSGDTVQRGAGGHGGFPEGSVMENPSANTGDTGHSGSVPESGRCPRGGNGNPLQYSCLEHAIDREPGGLQSTGSQRVRQDWAHRCAQHRGLSLR